MRVDLVIPFVDSTDPEWFSLYQKTFNENPIKKYRPNTDFLKYNLRSIAQNIPWIDTVHLIVMSESQIPNWINKENVNIVYHKDIIPEQYLPTFNSSTIELFQYKIPNLAEHYLVGNDDYFVVTPLLKEDFYTSDGVPKITWMKGINIENTTPWQSQVSKMYHFFVHNLAGDVIVPNHTYSPHTKQSWVQLWKEYSEALNNSITQKADGKNFCQYAAQYFLLSRQECTSGSIDGACYQFILPYVLCFMYDLISQSRQMLCLNDTCDDEGLINDDSPIYKKVINLLQECFPEKCKYEY